MSGRDDMNLTPEERQLQDALRDLQDVRPDADFQARLRREFASGQIETPVDTPKVRGKVIRWPFAAVPVLAAAVIALVMLASPGPRWEVHTLSGEGVIQVDGTEVDAADADRLAELVKPGSRLKVPQGVQVELVYDDVLVFGIMDDSDVTIPVEEPGSGETLVATVVIGELLTKTGPGFPGTHLEFLSPEGRAEIVGTTLAINSGVGYTCVCVLEGAASVGRDPSHCNKIPGGMRKVMFADGREPLFIAIESTHQEHLVAFEARNANLWH
jgi:hypothetical protein